MALTLLVPDLLPPADAPAALREVRLPALERALGRAAIERVPCDGAEGWLAADWGVPSPAPYAALSLAGDDAPREGTWLRADPVHLRIERDLVTLRDASVLDVSHGEAEQMAAALQDVFGGDGLEIRAVTPERWYAFIPEAAVPRTTPLHAVVGRDIFTLLPRGGEPLNWRSMITEAQMVLSSHPANAAREASGRPAINSVWFWGEGRLAPAYSARYGRVFAEDALPRGLARVAGVETQALPDRLEAIPPQSGDALAVVSGLTRPLRRADLDGWVATAKGIDERWIAPAMKAVATFGTVRIVLPGESVAVILTLTPGSRWKVFSKKGRLFDHA